MASDGDGGRNRVGEFVRSSYAAISSRLGALREHVAPSSSYGHLNRGHDEELASMDEGSQIHADDDRPIEEQEAPGDGPANDSDQNLKNQRANLEYFIQTFGLTKSVFTSRTFRGRATTTLKESFAYCLAALFVVISPISAFLGEMSFTAVMPSSLAAVSDTVGANIQWTVMCILGLSLGTAAGLFTVVVGSVHPVVLLICIFVFSMMFTLIKAVKRSLRFIGTTGAIVLVIVAFTEPSEEISLTSIAASLFYSFLLGLVLCCLIAFAVLPQRATSLQRAAMASLLNALTESLQLALVDIALEVDTDHSLLPSERVAYENLPFSGEDHAERMLPSAKRIASHRARHLWQISQAKHAMVSMPSLREEAQWEFGHVFYHYDQYLMYEQTLGQMVRLIGAVGCSTSEEAAHLTPELMELALRQGNLHSRRPPPLIIKNKTSDMPSLRLPPSAMRSASAFDVDAMSAAARRSELERRDSDASDLSTWSASSLPLPTTKPPGLLAMGSARPPSSSPYVTLQGHSHMSPPRGAKLEEPSDLDSNASTQSLDSFAMASSPPSKEVSTAAKWLVAQQQHQKNRRMSIDPTAVGMNPSSSSPRSIPTATPVEAKEEEQPNIAAPDARDVDKYLRAMREPIATVQRRFSKYSQEIAVLSHEGRTEEIDQYVLEDLRSVLEDLDVAQSEVLGKLDPQSDLNFIHFRIFSLRELVLELVSLITIINAIANEPNNFWASLWRLVVETFTFDMDVMPPRDEAIDKQTWRYRMWRRFNLVGSIKFKFAFKTATALTFLSLFSVVKVFADFFYIWRGTWGLVTIAMVSSPTFGGNIQNSVNRVLGTVMAALYSVLVWLIFPNQPVGIFFCVVFFSIPMFYLQLHVRVARGMGSQSLAALYPILLAYYDVPYIENVYSTIYEVAYKRALAIVVGVIFALIVGRYVWPYLARTAIRRKLSRVLSDLGLAFSMLQSHFESGTFVKFEGQTPLPPTPEELLARQHETEQMVETVKRMESDIEMMLTDCADLHEDAMVEPRLKAPWPAAEYADLLMFTQDILNHLTCLRVLLLRGVGSELQEELVIPLKNVRRSVSGDMMLYFFIMSSVMICKYSLPPKMPPVVRSVGRQIIKVRKIVPKGTTSAESVQLALFFAYNYNLLGMAEALENAGFKAAELFGRNYFVTDVDGLTS